MLAYLHDEAGKYSGANVRTNEHTHNNAPRQNSISHQTIAMGQAQAGFLANKIRNELNGETVGR
jgi:hypothetical protein